MSQQINLLSSRARKKRFSFSSTNTLSAGIGAAVLLALLVAVYEDYRLQRIEAQARAVAGSLKEVSAEAEKASAAPVPRKPSPELEAKIAELSAQLKNRQDIVDALRGGAIGSTTGFSEYMRVFSRQSLEGLWLTGFDIASGGGDLTLAGRALRADLVPAYLERLNREAPMQGRQFASMAINQSASVKETAARPRLPPHVEFVISTGSVDDARLRAGASTQPAPAR